MSKWRDLFLVVLGIVAVTVVTSLSVHSVASEAKTNMTAARNEVADQLSMGDFGKCRSLAECYRIMPSVRKEVDRVQDDRKSLYKPLFPSLTPQIDEFLWEADVNVD